MSTVEATVKAAIQAQIVAALTSGPEKMIESLVKAAFEQPVDKNTGKPDGYSSNRVSYLDWLVLDTIRMAAERAVREAVTQKTDEIKALVVARVTQESVEAAAEEILGNFRSQDWRIDVKFGNRS